MRFIPLRSRPMITGLIIRVAKSGGLCGNPPGSLAAGVALRPPLLFLLNRHPASLSRAHSLRTLALCWSCSDRQPTP